MQPISWTCPYCERAVTITDETRSSSSHHFWTENAHGYRGLFTDFTLCPNPSCRRLTLTAALHEISEDGFGGTHIGDKLQEWQLAPESQAKQFPPYIPDSIITDYREACSIRTASPKASATLSRRCLQGIIRDYWKVKPGRLVDEIEDIREKVDPLTWGAIDAVRKIGNIGAHMEKNIDLIVDVDSDEAELLIGLVETLLRDWYIQREERKQRMTTLIAAAAAKKPGHANNNAPPAPNA